jgi:hypothetical protein
MDTPRFAIALPSSRTTQRAGSGVLTFTVSTPQKIKSELSTGGQGFDVRYARRVCTISVGSQSFQIVDASSLVIGGKTIPLKGPKLYITASKDGKSAVAAAPPDWYAVAYRQSSWSIGTQVAEKTQDIHPIPPPPPGSIWAGRALSGTNLAAIDCARFALAVQSKGASGRAVLSKGASRVVAYPPLVSHLDIMVDGPGNASMFVDSVQERYQPGSAAFTIGGASAKIVDHGARLVLPTTTLDLRGAKKYVTIAPDGSISVATRKPAWFAAFDRAPADPPHMAYTVSAE